MTSIPDKDRSSRPFVSPGMPALDLSGKPFSFFEFWPTWLIYIPVAVQTLVQGLFHRSITLPLLANPCLSLGGMVGTPKSNLLAQATGECRQVILDWFVHTLDTQSMETQIHAIRGQLDKHGMTWPVVCKPDIGCRGNGVRLVKNDTELEAYLSGYPSGAGIMIQKLASWEPEAGVFYVRNPGGEKGRIISLALKYMPYVIGNGFHTLSQLIELDPRAGQLKHLYLERHKHNLEKVIPEGEPYRLIFSASHCKGAIFREGKEYITASLTDKIDFLMNEIPEFYYGRLDIKFRNLDALQKGHDIEIIEINAASSESLHIWDRNTSFWEAMTVLLRQYRILFKIGARNRERGFRPPGILALIRGWRLERKLSKDYPSTN